MEAVSLTSRVSVHPDAVFRELDGEGVLLNLTSGLYFGLNEVGTRIWRLIEEDGEIQRIVTALAEEYDAPTDRLREDLISLILQLRDKGLVHVEPAG